MTPDPHLSLEIEIANQQDRYAVDQPSLHSAVAWVLDQHHITHGSVSVAVVDNSTIHALNRAHLQHDYATDVLSFVFEYRPPCLHGEVIVSADMAADRCAEFSWSAHQELLLYVIHGCLHLVGFDDHSQDDIRAMRAQEVAALASLGIDFPDDVHPRGSDRSTTGAKS